MPEFVKNEKVDKFLYLDCDTVTLGDLSVLYEKSIEQKALAAVKDSMSKEILRIYFYPGLKDYFNSGVMLINLKKWKQFNLKEKAEEFFKNYGQYIIRADQDILNCLFKDDWKELDLKYNLDLKRGRKSYKIASQAVILHYSDKIKPWHYLFVGGSKKFYFQYLGKTPWKDFKYQDKSLKNFFKKYLINFFKLSKLLALKFIPKKLIDIYRKKLWASYRFRN
ncbi:MAG TPA: glycosyltransferase [Patescibacteria group bacterium]|nr:glycosyltransferase [Patescibacteria group bacterium]